MARIRTIKPEFWQNEDLAGIPEVARLVAIGLLNLSDDEGFFKAHPALIKSALFPLTEPSVSIHECLIHLSKIGYIEVRLGTDGKEYGFVKNFKTHQRVNRPTPSKYGPLIEFTEDSLIDHGGLTAGKERNRERKGKGKEQGKEQGKELSAAPRVSEKQNKIAEVFEFWKSVMSKSETVKITKGRSDKISERIKDGYSVDDMKKAIEGCAKSPYHMGKNDQKTVYDDLTLILRNAEKVDQFMSYASQIAPQELRDQQIDDWVSGNDYKINDIQGEVIEHGQ